MSHTRILGVSFFTGSLEQAVDRALAGGHVNAPSAPGMACDLIKSGAYRDALLNADMNITDSGAMVLLWRVLLGGKVPRHSGLKFLRALLERDEFRKPGAVFWVMPSVAESDRNTAWLNANGYPVEARSVYLAPFYGKGEIEDRDLLCQLEVERPPIVMLAIGGGVQERLARYLRKNLSYKPSILCLGAAIAFITGGQANIPVWADKLCLGWLFRVVYSPKRYLPRYWEALSIFFLMARYRDKLPPMAKGAIVQDVQVVEIPDAPAAGNPDNTPDLQDSRK